MKKVLKGILIVVVFVAVFGFCGNVESHYTRTATVTSVVNEVVTVEDTTGNVWKFYGNNFKEGETVKMKMFTNHTDNTITDDEIIKVKRV